MTLSHKTMALLGFNTRAKLAKMTIAEPPKTLSRIIRKKELPTFTGFGLTKIARLISEGKFPQGFPLAQDGRSLGWLEVELVEWQQARAAARDDVDAMKARNEKFQAKLNPAAAPPRPRKVKLKPADKKTKTRRA